MGGSVEEDSRSRVGGGRNLQVVGHSAHSPEAVGSSLLRRLRHRRLPAAVGSAAGTGHNKDRRLAVGGNGSHPRTFFPDLHKDCIFCPRLGTDPGPLLT